MRGLEQRIRRGGLKEASDNFEMLAGKTLIRSESRGGFKQKTDGSMFLFSKPLFRQTASPETKNLIIIF